MVDGKVESGCLAALLAPPRAQREELIDSYEHSEDDFRASFRDIQRINRYLGGTAVVIRRLKELIADPAGTITVLDVGTGSADIPRDVLRWARRRGLRMRVVAVDANTKVLRYALQESGGLDDLRLVKADANRLPFRSGSFDFAVSSLTFHHFDEAVATSVLREMDRVSRRGVIVNDLRRGYLPAALIWLVTRATGMHYLTRHDAPLSVMRSRTPDEYRLLAQRSGLSQATVYSHPFWRAALVARKG